MISSKDIQESFVPVRLEIVSPVHISANQNLSPLEYQVVEEQSGKYVVYTIDFDAWINSLSPEKAKEVTAVFSRSKQEEIWQYLHAKIDRNIFVKVKSKANQAVYKKCNDRLRGVTESENELAVAHRNALTSAMIIPGSSIKGAIRTAIINSLDNGELKKEISFAMSPKEKRNNYNNQLQKMFGKISQNAFKQLKVTDFELLPNESEFVQPVQFARNGTKISEMKPMSEVAPISTTPKFGKLYLGNFADNNEKAPLTDWTFEKLCEVCNAYYLERFKKEYTTFYTLPNFVKAKKFVDTIFEKVQNKNALLLRVGHYSHIECVTVDNNMPETPINKETKKPNPYGKTRTLANREMPFGWILLHKCSEQELITGQNQYEKDKAKIIEEIEQNKSFFIQREQEKFEQKIKAVEEARKREEERLKQLQAEKERQEQEKIQKEQEKQARKEAEQKKQEEEEKRLASLSPEQRLIELVLTKKATKEDVLKLYALLPNMENQVQIAEAIKSFWQKEKLWSGKQKPNQKDRVDTINKILINAKKQ